MNCQMEKGKEVPHWAEDRVGVGLGGACGPGSCRQGGEVGLGVSGPRAEQSVLGGVTHLP